MKPTISLLHASRRHLELNNPVAQEWTGRATQPVQYVLSLDAPEETASGSGHVVVVGGPNKGSVDAWNRAARESCGDVLVQLSDDFHCPQGWDVALLEAIGDVTQPVCLWCDDMLQARVCTIAVITRARYEQQGCLLWPEYRSVFSDDDLTAWALRDGVLRRADWIHMRHAWGGADGDDVYRHQNSPEAWALGQRVFERRKAQGFVPWRPSS